ncbi:DUF4402 domain-containing protein [Novosphingobium sp. FSY-8]|uniref:DUF4402 domain-containing protein n=1 Tax=Novosphingobium ovatum TaxID=1908523 RepID=A0ABW9XEQ1_9SPHN|nr:DUF4402 domain-containing protein [Novosphingobium ovatum]NBC36917.1 DUF4402 domain-containing protein [Novosphingobium ovatum]
MRAPLPLIAIAALVGLALPCAAQAASGHSSSATGAAMATVIRPLTVAKLSDLVFGNITMAFSQDGTVTVAADKSGATYTGGARPLCGLSGCGSVAVAEFQVTGEAERFYTISVPTEVSAQGISLEPSTRGQAVKAVTVDSLSVFAASTGSATTGRLDSSGQDTFSVGGRLILPLNSASAAYSATVPVIVTYI